MAPDGYGARAGGGDRLHRSDRAQQPGAATSVAGHGGSAAARCRTTDRPVTGPVLDTQWGRVEGTEEHGVRVFRGVPFAQPPAGELRFRPPRPPVPWTGVRPAHAFGLIAPQARPRPLIPGDPVEAGEDCLTLNVWTPALDGGRRPVLVWVHGGSFVNGSGASSLYDGRHLAARGDAVVVTINYRLGALGFLAHPDLRDEETGAAGNWGLLDQLAALRWVVAHAEALGGDPANVTVFGESAGAMSVSALLGARSGHGLVRRALAQSGGPTATTLEVAAATAERLVAEIGVAGGPAELRRVPIDVLLDAQARVLRQPAWEALPLATVIDGGVLDCHPLAGVSQGRAPSVSLLAGTNRDEMKFFAAADPDALQLDDDGLRSRLTRTLGEHAPDVIAVYKAARATRGQSTTPPELWWAIQTDWAFRVPSMRLADAQQRHSSETYAYLFTWESPVAGGALGACHGLEIPFVFGSLTYPGVSTFTGMGPEALALSRVMQDAWLAFARTGDPSTAELGDWPPYDGARRATMVLGPKCLVEEAPFEEERLVWDEIV